MKSIAQKKREARLARHRRVRKKVSGSAERPRLCVFKSARHIYVQAIDDLGQNTLAAASTLEARERFSDKDGVESAILVGADIAQRLKEKGIEQVVFDKGGFIYHGRVKALAEAARGERSISVWLRGNIPGLGNCQHLLHFLLRPQAATCTCHLFRNDRGQSPNMSAPRPRGTSPRRLPRTPAWWLS